MRLNEYRRLAVAGFAGSLRWKPPLEGGKQPAVCGSWPRQAGKVLPHVFLDVGYLRRGATLLPGYDPTQLPQLAPCMKIFQGVFALLFLHVCVSGCAIGWPFSSAFEFRMQVPVTSKFLNTLELLRSGSGITAAQTDPSCWCSGALQVPFSKSWLLGQCQTTKPSRDTQTEQEGRKVRGGSDVCIATILPSCLSWEKSH